MLARKGSLTRSSASRHSTQSWRAAATANCFCRPKPSHSFCSTRTAPAGEFGSAVGRARVDYHNLVGKRCALQTRAKPRRSVLVMMTTEKGWRGKGQDTL